MDAVVSSSGVLSITPVGQKQGQKTENPLAERYKALMCDMTLEEFVQSEQFVNAIQVASEQTHEDPLEVAQQAVSALVGLTGDALITGIDATEGIIDSLLSLVYVTLTGINHAGANVSRGLVRGLTLNQGSK